MIPAVIPGATRALGAPAGWDAARDGVCGTLPIRDSVYNDGSGDRYAMMESAWKPDAAEIAALAAGGSVILQIIGISHPVVSLYVIEDDAPEADIHAAAGVIVPDQPAGDPA